VLGGDWKPKSAAIFTTPLRGSEKPARTAAVLAAPRDQLALLGAPTSLSVALDGSGGAAKFQWLKNGQALAGAADATLRVQATTWDDAGVYRVIATRGNEVVATADARLTVVAPQTAPVSAAPRLPQIPPRVFSVADHGAAGDGATDNTAALQRTIDAAVAAGGGIVAVPAAPKSYLCGPITLGSHVNLEIQAGAVVQLLPYSDRARPGAYPLQADSYPNFITAANAQDVAITGAGTIDGDGQAWWEAFRASRKMPHRPFLIRLSKCERVLLSGIMLTRSPMFHAAIGADHLTVVGVTVETSDGTPNTDGIDPAGSHHLIQNCAVSCGDDNIVMKPGGTFCSDITIADCAFGEGHGLSVGGQTNRGLDGMVVKNCSFEGTTSALRLKADPTQGGELKNVSYTNLTMHAVQYPFVFYSYYNKVGNPASISGSNRTTPEKVRAWNREPPNSLSTTTLPSWKNITVSGVYATAVKGHSIVWGLPLPGYFVENVKFAGVRISGGYGLELYNATNVEILGDSQVGPITSANALAIVGQPAAKTVKAGGEVTLKVAAIPTEPGDAAYQWQRDGKPLEEGPQPDGTVLSGTKSPQLTLAHAGAAAAGRYSAAVSAKLDVYEPARQALSEGSLEQTITSESAIVTVTP
jgi:polygalacturonase